MKIEELIRSLQTYEFSLPRTQQIPIPQDKVAPTITIYEGLLSLMQNVLSILDTMDKAYNPAPRVKKVQGWQFLTRPANPTRENRVWVYCNRVRVNPIRHDFFFCKKKKEEERPKSERVERQVSKSQNVDCRRTMKIEESRNGELEKAERVRTNRNPSPLVGVAAPARSPARRTPVARTPQSKPQPASRRSRTAYTRTLVARTLQSEPQPASRRSSTGPHGARPLPAVRTPARPHFSGSHLLLNLFQIFTSVFQFQCFTTFTLRQFGPVPIQVNFPLDLLMLVLILF